jgi:hypothetical protein
MTIRAMRDSGMTPQQVVGRALAAAAAAS